MKPMMKLLLPSSFRKVALLMLLASLSGLVSCASTPQSRIARHPELFNALPARDKDLVSRGGIREGLHKDGVYLAWGPPASRMTGSRGGKRFDDWRYTRLEPVFVDEFAYFGGIGRYHGRRGYRYYDTYGLGYYPTVHYIPYVSAVVTFENDRVVSWRKVAM